MVFPRNGRRWLEELVKGANCWDMHGIQPTLELPRGTINASVHLRPCMLHWKEGVSEPARSWSHRKYPQFPDPQHHALTLAGRSSLTYRMCLGPTLNECPVLSELHSEVLLPTHIPSTSPCGLYKRNYTDATACLLLYSAAWSHCIVFAPYLIIG